MTIDERKQWKDTILEICHEYWEFMKGEWSCDDFIGELVKVIEACEGLEWWRTHEPGGLENARRRQVEVLKFNLQPYIDNFSGTSDQFAKRAASIVFQNIESIDAIRELGVKKLGPYDE
jgi:hypothetical protein